MTSNMSAGDRRWTSTRRGGMTVLGKVAVPKPINLPSQRLENQGLDPNVEIVPKGTLSWGSRPSSSSSNAWGSSSLSPNTDISSYSSSRHSVQPSLGEAGTRPSTAGSDKVHDSTPNAWSSNSRPTSASGALTSTQSSLASLRPRSAEPRPGSSQLSRFAERPSNISVAGGGERLELTSSKNDGFSLSTGHFPSLGSAKSSSEKSTCSQDPPFHDSGSTNGVAVTKEGSEKYSVEGNSRTDDSWRRDNPPHGEDGSRGGMEMQNADALPRQNPGFLPQHFNAWRGPPVNNPPGVVWYRGPPGGPPPSGEAVLPGGFPMEPFHYYRPQMPPSTLPNPTGPPTSGDIFRPPMPDAYMRSGMQVRPGFYAGPVPYDGYFGPPPPLGYRGPNDRDIPIMGMAGGPPSIYGPFPSQNAPDAGNSHVRPPGHVSNNRMQGLEEGESGGGHRDPQPYWVLLKPHDNWNEKSEAQKMEEAQRSSRSSTEKVDHYGASSWENGERDLEVRAVGEGASQKFDGKSTGSFIEGRLKSPEILENAREKVKDQARAEQKNFLATDGPQFIGPKNSSLIQKIEGLNAKARASGPPPDVMVVSDRPEQVNKWQVHAPYPTNVQAAPALSTEEKIHEETAVSGPNSSRRYPHGGQVKAHNLRGGGRFHPEDGDGYQNKPLLPTPPETSGVHRQMHPSSQPRRKYEGAYGPITAGPGDNQAEHAKMKEQRLKQRQEEEMERAEEQKAKAQMKLDELNRRVLFAEGSNPKTEIGILNNPPVLASPIESKTISSSPRLVSTRHLFPQTSRTGNSAVGRSSGPVTEFLQEPSRSASKESPSVNNQSVPASQDARIADADISKQHRTAYKQKQNTMSEKDTTQKIANEAQKSQVDGAGDVTTVDHTGTESLAHQRRRSNRGNRHKPKGDESSSAIPPAHKESSGSSTASIEDSRAKASDSETKQSVHQTLTESNDVNLILEQRPGSAHEEGHIRGNNQWKSPTSHRAPRNQQVNRAVDKFRGGDAPIWAPVRTQNKIEIANETSERTAEGQSLPVKSDQPLQSSNHPRNRRAEIERFVPRPAAKEISQQGSVHQQKDVSENQNETADEALQQGHSGSTSVAVKESRNTDGRQNRTGKGHGSWRQYGTTGSENVQKQTEHHQGPKLEERPAVEQIKHGDEGPSHDGLTMPSDSSNSASRPQVTAPLVRDQGISGRGTHPPPLKGPKGIGYSLETDQKKKTAESQGSPDPSPAPEVSHIDTAPRENHGVVERPTLHWQPKSREASGQTYRASRAGGGGQNISEPSGAHIEEASKEHAEARDRSSSVKGIMQEEAGKFDGNKRERRPQSFVARPNLPSQGPVGEQHKNGNQNTSRFERVDENHGEWNSNRQDTRQHNVWSHRERQRYNNSNYKYQPVGTYNTENRSSNFEGPRDDSQNTGPRYKERGGRSGSRRGRGNSSFDQQVGNT